MRVLLLLLPRERKVNSLFGLGWEFDKIQVVWGLMHLIESKGDSYGYFSEITNNQLKQEVFVGEYYLLPVDFFNFIVPIA